MKAYIYALKDPETLEVKYIGKTIEPKRRQKQHLTDGINAQKSSWINTLRENGKLPVFEVIEECELDNWQAREVYHIENERIKGSTLFNVAPGGGGIQKEKESGMFRFNFFLDDETRNMISSNMRKHGFSTVSAYIRFIIIKHFNDIDSSDK